MSQKALEKLKERFGYGVLETRNYAGDETAVVDRYAIKEVAAFLRDDTELRFNMLMDATAVDYLTYPGWSAPRFEVVYHFYSMTLKHRLRIKVRLPEEEPEVDTLCDLWPIANWLEREIWDMYGIRFRGHPELRRILLYEQFVGHPLRKDYPKEKRQPLVRRPETEIAEVLAKRGKARSLLQEK
jgi:NADH-quinone oxidoreductase subunit C